nr:hypothetical protein Iba_chr01fCG9780 [Ipomoea batatas]
MHAFRAPSQIIPNAMPEYHTRPVLHDDIRAYKYRHEYLRKAQLDCRPENCHAQPGPDLDFVRSTPVRSSLGICAPGVPRHVSKHSHCLDVQHIPVARRYADEIQFLTLIGNHCRSDTSLPSDIIDRLRLPPISSSSSTVDNICNPLHAPPPIGEDGEGADDWVGSGIYVEFGGKGFLGVFVKLMMKMASNGNAW